MTTLFYVLGGIVLLLVILALIAPKGYHVNREIAIENHCLKFLNI